MEKGKALNLLLDEIQFTITSASQFETIKENAETLNNELSRINWTIKHLNKYLIEGKIEKYLADATVFLEMMSYCVIGWQWLKMATKASEMIQSGEIPANNKAFYEGKIHTCQFYFKYEMPHTAACAATLLDESELTFIANFDVFH